LGLTQEIDIDALYEFCLAKQTLSKSVTDSTGTACSKWQEFFQGAREIGVFPVNVLKIVSSALSLPGCNAFPEKVFSLMNA
jgi:hypothetical protein